MSSTITAPTKLTSVPTIRAGSIEGPRRFELRRIGRPDPPPRHVLVRLEGCGVCASNVPVWLGQPWFEYPRDAGSPGHEGWGTIEEIGSGVSGWKEGDRVGILSTHAFAEYDIAPADGMVHLPAALGGKPFPAEPIGCAINVFLRSGIRPGQVVAIVGVGFLGGMLIQLARSAGARVVAVARRPFSLELARQQDADHVFGVDTAREEVEQLTHGEGCTRVIEAAGTQEALDLATDLTGVRGRLIVAGYHQDGPRQVNMQQWNWRGIDVINAHEREPLVYCDGMRRGIELIKQGQLDPARLITHDGPLERLPDLLDLASRRPDGFVKAVVWCK